MSQQTNESTRIETDTMGDIHVPSHAYYGAQSARSLQNFDIGLETFPREFIKAFGILKKAAAIVNANAGVLDHTKKHSSARRPMKLFRVTWMPIFRCGYGKLEVVLKPT